MDSFDVDSCLVLINYNKHGYLGFEALCRPQYAFNGKMDHQWFYDNKLMLLIKKLPSRIFSHQNNPPIYKYELG